VAVAARMRERAEPEAVSTAENLDGDYKPRNKHLRRALRVLRFLGIILAVGGISMALDFVFEKDWAGVGVAAALLLVGLVLLGLDTVARSRIARHERGY